jgi:small subunit ribosomal protein S4e
MTHLKRYAAPLTYPIARKIKKFATTIKGGGHKHEEAIPLRVVLRDMLGYAKTIKESKKIVSSGKVLVDQVVRKDDRFGVGLMGVVSIPDAKKHFRIVPKGKRFVLVEIPEKEAKIKLCRIENKTVVKGGNIQLNLHDGRNILIKVKNPEKPEEDVYKTKDSLIISLPDQ